MERRKRLRGKRVKTTDRRGKGGRKQENKIKKQENKIKKQEKGEEIANINLFLVFSLPSYPLST